MNRLITGIALLGAGGPDRELVRAHEMVHVIQQDFLIPAWSRPLESWGWRLLLDRDVPVDLGLVTFLGNPRLLRDIGEAEAGTLEFR